jgi:hypothetical protein
MQIDLVLLSFVFGFLISLIDYWEDEKRKQPKFLYIFLAAFLFLFLLFSKIFPLVLGVFIAMILSKKLDSKSWKIFLAVITIFLPFFVFSFQKIQLSTFSFLSTIYFFIFSFFDELGSNYADKKKAKKKNFVLKFFELRPFLEISSFIYSILIFDFDFFACVFFFDFAYNLEKRLLLI